MQRLERHHTNWLLEDGYLRLSSLEDMPLQFSLRVIDKLMIKCVVFIVSDGKLYGKRVF